MKRALYFIICLILFIGCHTSNQYQSGSLGFDQDCLAKDNSTALDSYLLSGSDKNKLIGLYLKDETFSPYALEIEEDGFDFYEHKLKAWHGTRTKFKNSGQWQYLDNHLILKDKKSQLILKIIEFQSNIWLVPTCQEDLFVEYISKINNSKGGDDLVTNREILYSSFLHKKIQYPEPD